MDEFRKQIIKTWMNRAEERYGSPFYGSNIGIFHADNLIFCCIAYEAYAFGKFQNALMSKNREQLSETYQNPFEELIESTPPTDLNESIDNLKKEIDRNQIEDMTPNSNRPSLDLPDKKDLDRILEIIYRIRSNLLHGGKEVDPLIERNMVLIKSSYIVLFHIMKMIIREENFSMC